MTTIKVKQEHIENGRPGSPSMCPVALAIKDAIDVSWKIGVQSVMVSEYGFTITDRGTCCFVFDEDISNKIVNFDRTKEMEPFEFEFDGGVPPTIFRDAFNAYYQKRNKTIISDME